MNKILSAQIQLIIKMAHDFKMFDEPRTQKAILDITTSYTMQKLDDERVLDIMEAFEKKLPIDCSEPRDCEALQNAYMLCQVLEQYYHEFKKVPNDELDYIDCCLFGRMFNLFDDVFIDHHGYMVQKYCLVDINGEINPIFLELLN